MILQIASTFFILFFLNGYLDQELRISNPRQDGIFEDFSLNSQQKLPGRVFRCE